MKNIAEVRAAMEKIMEESCTFGRSKGFKVRWEWRGDSMWFIDETESPPNEEEWFDVLSIN